MATVLCQLVLAPKVSQYSARVRIALSRLAGSPRKNNEVSSANMRLVNLVVSGRVSPCTSRLGSSNIYPSTSGAKKNR
jgi:hypothetical protein